MVVFWAETLTGSLNLTWVVLWDNNAPTEISSTPNWNPEYFYDGYRTQEFTITFKDYEKDEVSYTITVQTDWGSTDPLSGEILSLHYDSNNEAVINFIYSAPNNNVWNKKITITLNDGVNVVSYDIDVYIL